MPDHDPTEVNSLEEALRRMLPTPIDPAPLLFAAGRESASRSLRRWRWLAGAATMVAATLLGSQMLRVSPTPEVKVVHLIPAFASVDAPPVEVDVIEEPTQRRNLTTRGARF